MQSFQQSKLMRLLTHLNDEEFKELGLWLDSPIHNTSTSAVKLYQAVKSRVKRNMEIDFIYLLRTIGILAKGKNKKDITPKHTQEFRLAASKLTLQIEQYLIWKKSSQDVVNNNRILMDQLISKQLYDLVRPILNKTNKKLAVNQLRDIQYCKNQYSLDEIEFYLALIQKNRSVADSLNQVINSLQNACLTQLLRYYSAMVNFKNLISDKVEFPLMHTLKNYLETSNETKDFTVEIYFKQLILLERGNPDDYFEFKTLLFNSFEAFDRNELRQFFGFMSNFCNQMISKGYQLFLYERVEIYKTGLEMNCWVAGIYFSKHQFVNIVIAGLKVNEKEWVRSFIDTYQTQLDPKLSENTVNLSNAMLEFECQDYPKAHSFLNQVTKSEDFMHHSLMEVLMIKIYYQSEPLTFENYNYHPIHSRIKAFSAYLKIASGKKLSTQMQAIYMNFILILKQILQIQKRQLTGSQRKQVKKLELSIDELYSNCSKLNPLTEKDWLLKQIKALKQ